MEKFIAHAFCGVSVEMDMFGHAEERRSEVRGMLKKGKRAANFYGNVRRRTCVKNCGPADMWRTVM
jgi:hypothetical protein